MEIAIFWQLALNHVAYLKNQLIVLEALKRLIFEVISPHLRRRILDDLVKQKLGLLSSHELLLRDDLHADICGHDIQGKVLSWLFLG